MTNTLQVFIVACCITLAVGLLTAEGWVPYLIGAVLALALWAMAYYATANVTDGGPRVDATAYFLAGLVGIIVGYALVRMTDNLVFWSVAFIVAGVSIPVAMAARRRTPDDLG